MKRALAVALTAAWILADAAIAPAGAAISDMVDELRRIQVRIAQGENGTYERQAELLRSIAQAIANTNPQDWRDKREAHALVVFILSGGVLAGVVPLLSEERLAEPEQTLARGAIAYMTNHEADALELLSKVDLEALDLRLAAEVAFARSVLCARRDRKTAIALLDWARLASPGSLVEEAALRREIMTLAEEHDGAKLALLARQYAQRFASSMFASDFFLALAGTIARTGVADDPAMRQRLSEVVSDLPADKGRAFLLTVARAAIVNARFDLAGWASDEVSRGARLPGGEAIRARLYADAARLLFEDGETASADLATLPTSMLAASDAHLLAAVRGVAAKLRTPPTFAEGSAGADKPEGSSPTIGQAEEALQRTARLLGEGRP